MSLVIGFVVTIFTHDIWSSGFFVLFYMFGYMLAVSLTPTVLSVCLSLGTSSSRFSPLLRSKVPFLAFVWALPPLSLPSCFDNINRWYHLSHDRNIGLHRLPCGLYPHRSIPLYIVVNGVIGIAVVNTVILFVIYLLPGGKHCAEASMYEALLCDWIVTTTKSKEETNKTEDEKENEDNSNKEETNKTEDQKENEDNNNKEEKKSEDNSDRVEVAIETQETASVEQTTVVKEEEKVPTIV